MDKAYIRQTGKMIPWGSVDLPTRSHEQISGAMPAAKYEILSDDKSFYGEIPGFHGVWANALTLALDFVTERAIVR